MTESVTLIPGKYYRITRNGKHRTFKVTGSTDDRYITCWHYEGKTHVNKQRVRTALDQSYLGEMYEISDVEAAKVVMGIKDE